MCKSINRGESRNLLSNCNNKCKILSFLQCVEKFGVFFYVYVKLFRIIYASTVETVTDFIMLHLIPWSLFFNTINMVIINCLILVNIIYEWSSMLGFSHCLLCKQSVSVPSIERQWRQRERERPEGSSWGKSCFAKLLSKQQPTNGWIIFTEIFSN